MTTGKMIKKTTVKAKVVIPLRSKIAGWWMLIMGGAAAIGLVLLLGGFVGGTGDEEEMGQILGVIFTLAGIAIIVFCFIPGLLVLIGGRWGWIIASVILSIAVAMSLYILIPGHYPNLYFLIPLTLFIPLILILSDHAPDKRGDDTK